MTCVLNPLGSPRLLPGLCSYQPALVSDDPSVAPTSCAGVLCTHGATCVVDAGGPPSCVCQLDCDDTDAGPTCGTDGQTYGSPCQLRLFACRMQKDVNVSHQGPCNGIVLIIYLRRPAASRSVDSIDADLGFFKAGCPI